LVGVCLRRLKWSTGSALSKALPQSPLHAIPITPRALPQLPPARSFWQGTVRGARDKEPCQNAYTVSGWAGGTVPRQKDLAQFVEV
jgi:hypothetical protein